MLVALGNQRLFYYKLLKIRKITLTHKKNYLDDTFSRDYMGIRGKPQLLMRLQDGQVQWMFWWLFIFWPSGCFGLFFAFRRAFVLREIKNFWPSGRPSAVFGIFLAWGKAEFFVLRGGRRPTRRTKKFSLSEGQKYPKYGWRPARRPKILNLPKDKCPSEVKK